MDAKTLAAALTGMEYRTQISGDLLKQAKKAGLVIVYGASDDLMEFEGAIYDEVGAYDGTEVEIDAQGLIPDFGDLDKDDKDKLRAYFSREGKGKTIKALWDSGDDGYYWRFETEIPHETFEIMEDGDTYCKGIVFSLADAA